jgi:hypothetical protein
MDTCNPDMLYVIFSSKENLIIMHLKRLVKHLLRIALKMKAQVAISRLCSADGISKLLGDALKETLQNDVTPDEKSG